VVESQFATHLRFRVIDNAHPARAKPARSWLRRAEPRTDFEAVASRPGCRPGPRPGAEVLRREAWPRTRRGAPWRPSLSVP
jgi:hypothetical protein